MSAELSPHVREEIDRWVAKFPPDRKRSAVISALHAAQHENNGFLTPALMDAVAGFAEVAQGLDDRQSRADRGLVEVVRASETTRIAERPVEREVGRSRGRDSAAPLAARGDGP